MDERGAKHVAIAFSSGHRRRASPLFRSLAFLLPALHSHRTRANHIRLIKKNGYHKDYYPAPLGQFKEESNIHCNRQCDITFTFISQRHSLVTQGALQHSGVLPPTPAAGRLPPRVPAELESATRFTHIHIIPFHFVELKYMYIHSTTHQHNANTLASTALAERHPKTCPSYERSIDT